ncbi:hypothetical protein Hanom_Chr17g01564671 [Helianthus anomalus]
MVVEVGSDNPVSIYWPHVRHLTTEKLRNVKLILTVVMAICDDNMTAGA